MEIIEFMMPVVSVIIPTYNRAEILPRAIDSILEQSFRDLEVIVVDDYSKDKTQAVVNSYSSARLEYIQHERNKGANAARNTGIRAATGEYIAFLDDDDMWLEMKVENQLEEFKSQETSFGLVYSGRRVIKEKEVIEDYIPTQEGSIYRNLLRRNVIPSETPLIRAKCFDRVGKFDTDFESCQDWDMWLRIAKLYDISYVPKILAVSFWDEDNRISSDCQRKCQGYRRLYKKYQSDIHREPISMWHFASRLGYYCSLQKVNSLFS